MEKITKIYLGIDWGTKRIGLAIGNDENKLATPYATVAKIEEIIKILKQEDIDEIVVGQPIKMSGRKKNLDPDFEKFLSVLKQQKNLPIALVDERLSSLGADALSGTKKTKAGRDQIAAMLVLQGYLDRN